ncbi:asparagine synthase-related protein [Streptomyces tauricus]|uniref:asparagine synthase-related protein n=1 Tax=Streptomyces tauricus TaxID=68274 RepID=UPI002244194C|nr:asparagine synthase-related protein [Streptomyces tauricus]MCW8097097.1 asparagine synthase-related protein [Streptomyces tauricus]
MMGPNLVAGFWARVSWSPRRAAPETPRFATQGHTSAVSAASAGRHLQGVAVSFGAPDTLVSDGGIHLLLAGEIYNRDEVAKALGNASAAHGSDATLVLAAWHHWGMTAFRILNGRFAALLLDGGGRVVVATDHAGSVPLWLRADAHGVDVSTEAKTLAGLPGTPLGVAGAQLLPGGTGVHRVQAGTALILETVQGEVRTANRVYTWIPPVSRAAVGEEIAVGRVRRLLAQAVQTRLRDDPEPTVVLSGGIDSSGVAAHAVAHGGLVHSVSMGTEASDEFGPAKVVAGHLGTDHSEMTIHSSDLVRELPWAVWAAEIADHTILEYLLPLIALYRRLPPGPRRVLTGYGADIPLGGMHRHTEPLDLLDSVIAHDMATFDGLNEMSPVISGVAGIWSTHPYWDRDLLDCLISLDPGLKRRYGRDKWVLREALARMLPAETLSRPKLGIHEGSGTSSAWTALLLEKGVPPGRVEQCKAAMARRMHDLIVLRTRHPDEISFDEVLAATEKGRTRHGLKQ